MKQKLIIATHQSNFYYFYTKYFRPMNFLKAILIIILFYYAFKLLMRLFAPFLLKKASEYMTKKFEEKIQQQQNNSPFQNKREVPKEKKIVGEYIDYEEVK